MVEKVLSAVKNFAITVVVATLLFGVTAYFVCGFLVQTMSPVLDGTSINDGLPDVLTPGQSLNDGDSTASDESGPGEDAPENPFSPGSEPEENPVEGESFNILFIGSDYAGETQKTTGNEYGLLGTYHETSADTIVLVRIDKERKEFTFTAIPSNMKVYVNGSMMTAGTLYNRYGTEFLVDKVTALTGIQIDYYAIVDVIGLPKLMETIGSVSFNVPQDIYLIDDRYMAGTSIDDSNRANAQLVLKAGMQEITSKNVLPLLRFSDYADGMDGKTATYLSFLQAVVAKMTDLSNLTRAAELYQQMSGMIETNFTLADLTANLDLIFTYAKYGGTNLAYPGLTRVEDGVSYFVPDTIEAISMFKNYRRETVKASSGETASASDEGAAPSANGTGGVAAPSVLN